MILQERNLESKLIVILLTGFCLFLFAFHFRKQKDINFADPAVVLFLMFCYSVLLKVIYIYGLRPTDISKWLAIASDPMFLGKSQDIIVNGTIYITLCLTAFFIGYWYNGNLLQQKFPVGTHISSGTVQLLSVGFIVISMVSLIVFLSLPDIAQRGEMFQKKFNHLPGGTTERFFYSSYWWFKVATLVKCGFYALLIVWLEKGERGSKLFYAVLIASFVATMVIYNFTANRATSVLLLLEFAIIWSLRPSLKSAVLYVIFGAVLISTIVLSTQYRYASLSKFNPKIAEAQKKKEVAKPKVTPERTAPTPPKAGVSDSKSKTTEAEQRHRKVMNARILEAFGQGRYAFDLVKTSHIIEHFPEKTPYLFGETFVGWLFVIVPTSIWPDKPRFATVPAVLSGKIFNQPKNNVPPSIIAESYFNFGWAGFLVFLVVGFITKLAYSITKNNIQSGVVIVLGAIVLTRLTVVMFHASFGAAILKILVDIIPVALIIGIAWWVGSRKAAA